MQVAASTSNVTGAAGSRSDTETVQRNAGESQAPDRYSLASDLAPASTISNDYTPSDKSRDVRSGGSQPSFEIQIPSGFTGLEQGCIAGDGCLNSSPPDVQVATDAHQVVEIVNEHVGIWTNQGNSVKNQSLANFMGVEARDFVFDPRVLYDPSSQRWFAAAVDKTISTFLYGVSDTGDPTGSWTIYHHKFTSGYWSDYPRIGVTSDKFIISWNDYTLSGDEFSSTEINLYDKATLLSLPGTIFSKNYNLDRSQFSAFPARMFGPTDDAFLVDVDRRNSAIRLHVISGPWNSSNLSTFKLPVSPIELAANATQKGSGDLLDPGDTRVLDVVWSNDVMWVAFDAGCTPSGDSEERSCIRLVQVDTRQHVVVSESTLRATGFYYFYPAMSWDSQGNLIIAFGYSSPEDYPSLAVTVVPAGLASFIRPQTVRSGTGPITRENHCFFERGTCRYGDYFGANTDPSAGLVWVAGEVGTESGWSTYIASIGYKNVTPQVPVTLAYALQNGGAGYSPPVLSYQSNGEMRTELLGVPPRTFNIDKGSNISVTRVLGGSTGTERWATAAITSGIVKDPVNYTYVYYHQYFVGLNWRLSDGLTPSVPILNFTQFQHFYSTRLNTSLAYWMDSGSAWSITKVLIGNTGLERWYASRLTQGIVSSPLSEGIDYHHQYYVTFERSPEGGGSVFSQNSWFDGGTSITLSASPSSGWEFERWEGGSPSSYSGTDNPASVVVDGPLKERAVFFAGVQISSRGEGSIAYESAAGSGQVESDGVETIYLPPGTVLHLTAHPSSLFTALLQWSGGVAGKAGSVSLPVDSPINVRAEFGDNGLLGAIVIFSVIAGIAVGVVVWKKRSGVPTPSSAEPKMQHIYCQNCGSQLPLEAQFCTECGEPA